MAMLGRRKEEEGRKKGRRRKEVEDAGLLGDVVRKKEKHIIHCGI